MPSQAAATLRSATRADYDSLVALLEAADLPTAGLHPDLPGFCVAQVDGRVVGGIGVELYGSSALLRSAVVAPELRGTGIGPRLVRDILEYARVRGVTEVFLLTTTAEEFFRRRGFTAIDRGDVAPSVTESIEFRGACPDTAVLMRMRMPQAVAGTG